MLLSRPISFCYLLLLLVLVILGCTTGPSVEGSENVRCIKREAVALLDFKKSFTSTYLADSQLFTWISPDDDCCEWFGITCDNRTGHVVSLVLSYEILMSNQLRRSLLELQELQTLDLGWNDFSMPIPEFIGSLSKLTYLDLSHAGFTGMVPPHLGNLSSLQTLILGGQDPSFYVDNFTCFSGLSTLETLDLSNVNLSNARDWLSALGKLPSLSSFQCSRCLLPPPDLLSISHSTSLGILDLSYNTLSSSLTSWLLNSSGTLLGLNLSYMDIDGPFPNLFQKMASLSSLQLSGYDHLEQGTLESIGNLCNLKELILSDCGMNQSLTDVLVTLKHCASVSLETLELSSNNLTGTFPSVMKFPSLIQLNLSYNQLGSLLPQDSTVLPKLETLDVSFNGLKNLTAVLRHLPASLKGLYLSSSSFKDVISDIEVSNFTELKTLDLSHNPDLTLNFSKPPFQLDYIGLKSCGSGPDFPNWLLTQKSFSWLDISSSMISGSIPHMFWNNLPSSLKYLDLSFNKFHEKLPNLQLPYHIDTADVVDLRSNAFHGPVPSFLFTHFRADQLYLSNNCFSSFAPLPYSSNSSTFLSKSTRTHAFSSFIDISNNLLSGTIPSWFWEVQQTNLGLSVANNRLSGKIPSSIGFLTEVHSLSFSNNSFYGEIPSSLKNCTKLGLLDLSWNRFTGYIPDWIGENLIHLMVLSLRSNNFSGNLPSTLCHLSALRILDLSHNQLSGNIPSCVSNFSAMAGDLTSIHQLDLLLKYVIYIHDGMQDLFVYALFNWKGKDRTFENYITMLIDVDLSDNDLSGEIPTEITSLVKLQSLDLSSNNLSGSIPAKIGKMTSLESLNLSWNKLSGQIPSSLSDISSLSQLSVSHNNLSGKIPTGTQLQSFGASAYAGNLKLCGSPLPLNCTGDGEAVPPSPTMAIKNRNNWDMQSFDGALGIGFAFGLQGILGAINFFHFANDFVNSLVAAALSVLR